MKRNLILLLIIINFTACSEWLDVQPKTSIEQNELFEKEYGFKDVLTGFYLLMGTEQLYAKDLTHGYMDMLAGRYTYVQGISNWGNIYNYKGDYQTKINALYSNIYNIIANINNFLYFIDHNRHVIKTKNYYETMKGEALGLRAFLHFELLRMYGPVYSGDPQAKSISYRNRFDNIPTPLLPASEVVDKCIADLIEADSLLTIGDSQLFKYNEAADQFTVMRQFRMNIWAVKATLARIYCYKGDAESKSLALGYANEVISSQKFQLCQTNRGNKILTGEHIFALYVEDLYKIVDPIFIDQDKSTIMGAKESFIDQIYEKTSGGATDFRRGTYSFRSLSMDDGTKKLVLDKYNQSDYSKGYQSYDGINTIPLIRLPEMYYIMAECEPNAIVAAKYIDDVRTSRGISSDDAVYVPNFDQNDQRNNQDQEHTVRINELTKEYQKEFYGEGQLFYFLKRHNYKTFLNCPLNDVREKYVFPTPDNEYNFGNNN